MLKSNRLLIAMFLALGLILIYNQALAETPKIQISGPNSVAVGETVQLSATTSTGIQENYYWYVSSYIGHQPFNVDSNGTVTGLNIGTGTIGVLGQQSGASKFIEFTTMSDKEVTLFLDTQIISSQSHDYYLELDCEVKNKPPKGSGLYVAVEIEDKFYFFPSLTNNLEVWKKEPKAIKYEVFQLPIKSIPQNDYTFYAATLKANNEPNSNIATEKFSGGETSFSN